MNVITVLVGQLVRGAIAGLVGWLASLGINLPEGWADEASVALASAIGYLAVKYGDDVWNWLKKRLGLGAA